MFFKIIFNYLGEKKDKKSTYLTDSDNSDEEKDMSESIEQTDNDEWTDTDSDSADSDSEPPAKKIRKSHEISDSDNEDDDDDDDDVDDDGNDDSGGSDDDDDKDEKKKNKKPKAIANPKSFDPEPSNNLIPITKDQQLKNFKDWDFGECLKTARIDFAAWQADHVGRDAYFFGPDSVSYILFIT